MTEMPSRTSAIFINEALQVGICSSSLDRLMKGVGEIWEDNREKFDRKIVEQITIPKQVLAYLKKLLEKKPRNATLADQVTYFTRNKHRMKYAQAKTAGSGIVEAACKTVVSERLKRSGMQWDYEGAQSVLSLRAASRSGKFDTSFDMILSEVNKNVIPLKKIKRNHYEIMAQSIAA